jgi:hypothetical protein
MTGPTPIWPIPIATDADRLAPIADSCSVQRQRQHKTRSGTAYLFHSMSVGVQCCSGLGKSTHA